MKKVGIMTWFTYNNYGSLLQAYSMQSVIQKMGYTAVLINYDPQEKIRFNYSLDNNPKKLIIKVINKLKFYINNKIIYKVEYNSNPFDDFRRNYLNISKKCCTSSDLYMLNKEFSCFICGSDQIWAPSVFDEKYFLDFVDNKKRKIAYAPSIGLPSIENKNIKTKMATLINNIEFLSTREENGKKIIKEISGRNAKVVLDPTLLINKKEWVENFNLEKNNDNYILYYFLSSNKNTYKEAKKIAKKLNKKLLIIPCSNKDYYQKECIKDDIDPKKFVSLIYNADLVLTDSFHGTIFSINLNIPFITFKRFKDNKKSQNSRIYNILSLTDLNSRIYSKKMLINKRILDLDFNYANKIIEQNRKSSLGFLKKSLSKAVEAEFKNEIITNTCTGCGICSVICPKKCIKIEKNSNGFYERKIDKKKCINCGLCSMVCGQNYESDSLNLISDSKLFSGHSNDEQILLSSASGGLAKELSLQSLNNNIPVIGCAYNYDLNIANHVVVSDINDLNKLSGSKYLQSYSLDSFLKLKDLKSGLIIGTPCQIASVDLYLKKIKKRENFILIDLICHGVPSYNLWDKYLRESKKTNIKEVRFRDKKFGWRRKCLKILTNKAYYSKESKDEFLKFFTYGLIYNNSCYECKFRDRSAADIRLGDYWGEKFKTNKTGVSMIISLTESGDKLLKELKDKNRATIFQEDINDYFKAQQSKNLTKPLYYDNLLNEMKNNDYTLEQLDKKYIKPILRRNKSIIFKVINTLNNIRKKLKNEQK